MGGQYIWRSGESPPELGEHSLAKHKVLERYLKVYVEVLTANPRREELRLTLVDGFAGGGLYRHPKDKGRHEGSPLIMLRAMEEAEYMAQARRTKPGFRIDARFFFVESDKRTFAHLQDSILSPDFVNKYKAHARLMHSTFREAAPHIIDAIESYAGREHRCIFLLDQYGWSDVPLDIIRTILRKFPKAEILLTFSTDKLITYISEQSAPTLREIGLGGVADRLPVLLQADPTTKRRLIQQCLTDTLISGCGAAYYTPFFIRPGEVNNNDYWFLHLSNHVRARDEMAKLHWDMQNCFAHFGGPGLAMLGYDPRKDDILQRQEPIFEFDNDAKPLTASALRTQFVRRIAEQWPQGIRLDELVQSVSNETPAHKGIMHDVLRECASDGELDIYSENDRRRDPHVQKIADSDRICVSRQLRFDLKPRA